MNTHNIRRTAARPLVMDPIETAGRDEISVLQLQRLQWSVRHAYDNVPHFQERCRKQDVHPDDLRTLEDLSRFPCTTKEDLRQTYPFGMFAVPMDRVVRLHASSGTTGKPTVVGYTKNDVDMWADVMARSIRAAGGRPGDMCHIAYGYGLFTGGLGSHYGAERLGCTVVPMSGGQTEKQVRMIADFKPRIIMATPSYMLALADEMDRQGIKGESCSIEIGLFGAEPWTQSMRAEIETRLHMDAVDLYGLSEVIGPGVAAECVETKDGLHVWEDHFYPEIIDPETGKPLPDGEIGELVFTSLTKEALPIIRYRTRDLTRLLPGTARSFRRLDKITGRSDDMIIIRGVNLFPSQIEELILKDSRLSPHYQLEIHRDHHMDRLAVNVETRPDQDCDESLRLSAAYDLGHHIKSLIGISAAVNILPPDRIERSMGKAKRVVDLRPKD